MPKPDPVAADSVMRTPVPASGTTLFLREEGSRTFLPVHHQSSITLRDLAEEFNVSSVVECDAQGNVQPRAVAFDSPSDVLHSGRHYIARRDARTEAGGSYVTFRGKILVKEYELEHPTTPASRAATTAAPGAENGNATAHSQPGTRTAPAGTPLPAKRRVQEAMERNEAGSAAGACSGCSPAPCSNSHDSALTIARALALSSERKRPREEATGVLENVVVDVRQDGAALPAGAADATGGAQTNNEGGVLQDRTNTAAVTGKMPSPPDDSASLPQEASTAAGPAQRSLRFIPFAETAADGTETYVTLEDLQQLCKEVSTQAEEFQRRHKAATDILESARRVLFTAGEGE